ncbi:MAG: hypothetical protein LBG64_01905, partial [Pseudomonadales bacterium]|nr:hypothetical protein [Pseudomonadales bacterium]
WLLAWSKIKPLNIHPSALPKYRGASPGQFALLAGDRTSAVSIIEVTDKLDAGDIWWQENFSVDQSWTASDYYKFAFDFTMPHLADTMEKVATKQITAKSQPANAPLPLARQLTKDDSFVSWQTLGKLLQIESGGGSQANSSTLTDEPHGLLMSLLTNLTPLDQVKQVERACRAFDPWPPMWTYYQGKRMQILKCHIENELLVLDLVKIEGKSANSFTDSYTAP